MGRNFHRAGALSTPGLGWLVAVGADGEGLAGWGAPLGEYGRVEPRKKKHLKDL